MKIVVFGASGKTGTEIVKQALKQGHHVIAFVRTPSKFKIEDARIEIVRGDVTDFSKVAMAIMRGDAVISALGAKSPFQYDRSITEGTINILSAMKIYNVGRFIYMSFVGLKETRHAAGFVIKHITPKLLSTEIKGHEIRESLIKESALNWTIVRSATLTNNKPRRQFKTGENIKAKGFTNMISRADVADFLLELATGNEFIKATPVIMN